MFEISRQKKIPSQWKRLLRKWKNLRGLVFAAHRRSVKAELWPRWHCNACHGQTLGHSSWSLSLYSQWKHPRPPVSVAVSQSQLCDLCPVSIIPLPFCRCKIPLFCKNYVRKFRSVTAVNSKKIRNGSGNGDGNGVRKRQRLMGTAKR